MNADPHDLKALETHISRLFFTPDRVFKTLKPLENPFLDHRSTKSRLQAIDQEYELNRRIAPDVYLGTADVVEDGEVVDRMLVMRRLPDHRCLTAIIRGGFLTDDQIRGIAREVAVFHSAIEPILDLNSAGGLDQHRQRWQDNVAAIEPFEGVIVGEDDAARIRVLVDDYLDGHAELFEQRVHDGNIRDGHGDLLADDIYMLDDGPRILDCLAFRDDFRIGDVLSDVAFLAMDLHRLAGPVAAQDLIRWYGEFSGERHPGSLAHHYVAYRAHVRCKVACLRVQQGDMEYAAVARMYHRMTLDQLERARSHVVLVGGGPGTGKTTVSGRISDHYGWAVLSSDEVRKELVGEDPRVHQVAEPDKGIYRPELTAKTYEELLRQAEVVLASGTSVVLDASWTSGEHREAARALARSRRAELVEIECTIDVATARERVARRLADGWNPSDATPAVVDHLRAERDAWPEACGLETSQHPERSTAQALDIIESGCVDAEKRSRAFWGKQSELATFVAMGTSTTTIYTSGEATTT